MSAESFLTPGTGDHEAESGACDSRHPDLRDHHCVLPVGKLLIVSYKTYREIGLY